MSESGEREDVMGGLDLDTFQNGVAPPFETWESDHAALVHVLWSAKHADLTLKNDCDAIAGMILRSHWLAAYSAPVPHPDPAATGVGEEG